MTAQTDAAVIHASRTDPHRFGDIFERHFDAVHGYLARRAGVEVADELTGEVFRVAFERRRSFARDRVSARPWLYGIATNVIRRHQRETWRRLRAHSRLHTWTPNQVDDTADASASYLDAVAQRDRLAAALGGLARRDRDALLLHVWEGLTYAEVAEALEVPTGTVRSRLNRARRQLRAALSESERDGGGQHLAADLL